MSSGALIAFEGLDQSGKQTQAELLRDWLKQEGRKARLVSFPDYATSIGEEIARALQGEREYRPDVMQLLYIANRYERKPDLQRWLDGGLVLVCDRYIASSIAYGEAQGLDPTWLADMQKFLPSPALSIMLDIAPETAVRRKSVDRDRYERDLAMQTRVRESYRRAAEGRDRRRCLQRGRHTTPAAVSASQTPPSIPARGPPPLIVDAFGVSPHALEPIEDAGLRGEDVHDEIEVIEQHPFRSVVPLHVRRLGAVGRERRQHAVGDRANLPRIAPRAQDEVIGESGGFPQIEHDEIQRLLVRGGADGGIDLSRESRSLLGLLSFGHATCLSPGAAVDRCHVGPEASTCTVRVARCVAAHRDR